MRFPVGEALIRIGGDDLRARVLEQVSATPPGLGKTPFEIEMRSTGHGVFCRDLERIHLTAPRRGEAQGFTFLHRDAFDEKFALSIEQPQMNIRTCGLDTAEDAVDGKDENLRET